MSELILISLIIVGILVVIGLVLTFVVYKKRKKEGEMKEPNYQVFFTIGIVWLPVGVVFMITLNSAIGIAFMAMGIVYMAIGLANRDKWEKKK